MNPMPARMFNELFVQRLDTADGKVKTAELGQSFIRDRLREVAYCRKILPPQTVTRQDCQRSVNHDTLCKIIDIEPQSKAMAMTFRGQPRARYIRADKVELAFFTISSEMFQKTEQELMAYEMPVTKVIEENSIKDLQEIEDREFTTHVESAVQALQTEANGGTATALNASGIQAGSVVEFSVIKGELARESTADDATVHPMQKPDIVNLFKLMDSNRLRAHQLLFHEADWDDVLMWTIEDFGSKVQSETVVSGYKYNEILGKPYVRSIKGDILRRGNVYCFASPEFFGRFYVLNNPKFYIDKVANQISFQCWEDIGMLIANIAAVRKLELYSADACPTTNQQTLLASFVPKAEDELGAINNRVASGLRFPNVGQY